MNAHLPPEDHVIIHNILVQAASIQGGMPQLLSMPLRFQEVNGQVQFVYPQWMNDIRHYLGDKYGESESVNLMQDILFELTNDPNATYL